MAEYTNIACQNKQSANALLVYLDAELKQDEEPPDIPGHHSGSWLAGLFIAMAKRARPDSTGRESGKQ
jgi:hypothetical protein